MKKIIFAMILAFILTASSFSQGYQKDIIWIGPSLGYAFGNIGFGAIAEYGINDNISIGLDLGYSGFREDFAGFMGKETYFDYTLFGVLAAGSYHFSPKKKFDPYIKLGMGYFNWNFKYIDNGKEVPLPYGASAAYTSGVGLTGQVGMRYHISNQFSLRAGLGYPFLFSAGIDLALGESQNEKRERSSTSNVKEVIPDEIVESPKTESDKTDTPKEVKKAKDRFSIFGGMYLGGKASINTVNPDGRKNGVSSGIPDIGISTLLPFEKNGNIGFLLNFGLDRYSFTTKPYDSHVANDLNTITEHYNYVNLSPSLYLGGFVIGFNFGFPASAYAENKEGKEVTVLDSRGINNVYNLSSLDISNYMATLIEVKLGGSIPLVTSNFGSLFFNIMASYTLSGVYDNPKVYMFSYEKNTNTGVTESKSDLNPTPVSLSLGISYLFKIGL